MAALAAPVAVADAAARRDARGGAAGIDAAARAALRAQIARLERELATVVAASYPRIVTPPALARARAPRLLDLGQLERARDALAARVATAHRRAEAQSVAQGAARERLAAMLARPAEHKGEKIANRELGLPGCTTYAVLPRLGPVGLLTGWWRVKISSGCP